MFTNDKGIMNDEILSNSTELMPNEIKIGVSLYQLLYVQLINTSGSGFPTLRTFHSNMR
jgi:hypothetical protein